jgi:hypothetical protein
MTTFPCFRQERRSRNDGCVYAIKRVQAPVFMSLEGISLRPFGLETLLLSDDLARHDDLPTWHIWARVGAAVQLRIMLPNCVYDGWHAKSESAKHWSARRCRVGIPGCQTGRCLL